MNLPLLGSLLRLGSVDQPTHQVVAAPVPYVRAIALGGAWSCGASDNAVRVRIAHHVSDYLPANYTQAVGGPSGVEAKSDQLRA